MNQPDPRLPLDCPKCGETLRYIATTIEPKRTYLYSCPSDGLFELWGENFGKGIRHTPGELDRQDC